MDEKESIFLVVFLLIWNIYSAELKNNLGVIADTVVVKGETVSEGPEGFVNWFLNFFTFQ